jgi:outer membrane protein OmpA-like peptidoglycan-associated protein
MKKFILFFATALLFSLNISAQKSAKEIKGDKFFERYSFTKAIEKYLESKELTNEGKKRLAESYKNTNQIAESKSAYERFITSSDATAEDVFNYASILRLKGNYEESIQWLNKFKDMAPEDKRAISYVNNAEQLENLHVDEGRYKITHLDVNTESQDFGTAYFKDKIVFATTREGAKSIKRKYNWNDMPFLNLYVSEREGDQLKEPEQLNKSLNNKLHDGPASFNAAGNQMVFTRNDPKMKGEDGTIRLQMFFTEKDEKDKWKKEVPFKLNNPNYSVGHPWLSKDGDEMYFASDMPGGFGGVDIYRITKNSDGTWGNPINLGETINTEGDEMFPFYQEEQGILFFASNGHIGLGGLDIYIAPDIGEGEFIKILNAGAPMNTRFDDFSLIVDENMKKGYFTSNREGGKGDDDIYAFQLLKPFNIGKQIIGTALDKEGNILASTIINLYDNNGQIINTVETSEDGKYKFSVDADLEFKLTGTKEDYLDGEKNVSTKTSDYEIIADVILEKDPGLTLYALVTDKKTGSPLEGVKMIIKDNETGVVEEFITQNSGDYRKILQDKKVNDKGSFNFTLIKEGYFSKTQTYEETFDKPGQYDVHIKLDFTMDPLVTDLSQMVQINEIYFEFNKYKIRTEAAVELNKIVEIMNKYPEMVIELGSHTDCRGTKTYNMKLSDKRAKASAEYIKERISNPDRIYGKGYGESKLLNDCACEGNKLSTCSEEEHDVNRRTEFKVISTGSDEIRVKTTGHNSFD